MSASLRSAMLTRICLCGLCTFCVCAAASATAISTTVIIHFALAVSLIVRAIAVFSGVRQDQVHRNTQLQLVDIKVLTRDIDSVERV